MAKHKSHEKNKKKGSQLVLRVDKSERDAFVALCDQIDSSAAREIRRFMREMIAAHSGKDGTPALAADVTAEPDAKAEGITDKGTRSIASQGDVAVWKDANKTVETAVEEDAEKNDETAFGPTAKPRRKPVRG